MRHKENRKYLMPHRLRKVDTEKMLPTVTPMVLDACKQLWESNEIPEFQEKEYMKYVAVEILHGERWRRVARIHSLDDAITEVRFVHDKFRSIYLERIEFIANHDGIDRRMVQPIETRTIQEVGVNYKIYGSEIE